MEGKYTVPVIDVAALVSGEGDLTQAGTEIGRACREHGFFYVTGHGVDEDLQSRLENQSREFFSLDVETKLEIRMALAGKAWRGYFPVGAELTSGKPDVKEGLYFGQELGPDDARVQARMPMHGANLFPAHPAGLRETVLEYLELMTTLGHAIMSGVALSLGLEQTYFADRYMHDPFVLFRIFHYPPTGSATSGDPTWGVGEHTDYGVLTILKQDETGGLQVKSQSGWITAMPIPGSFVCNIGDMLDRLTGGLYKSTPHRVRNVTEKGRLSFPFFFDPDFDALIEPIDLGLTGRTEYAHADRWDHANVHKFEGTYGDYILAKVAKVFPELNNVNST